MDFSFMSESVGKTVRLERGGPDKLSGTLLAIMPDAIALQTKDEGVVYVNAQHIKTISETVVPEIQMRSQVQADPNAPVVEEIQPPLIEASSFQDLLTQLKHRLIRVNHGGPNSLQGVLIEIRPDSMTILHDMKDYVHYPMYHVKSVTWILNLNDKQGNDKQGNQAQDDKSGKKANGGK